MPKSLQLVVVTPEKTVLDRPVAELRFPLYDGDIGVLPGRTPLIGRLGYGELKVTDESGGVQSYFVDGGFVQVQGETVSILTNRSLPADAIDADSAEEQLQQALAVVAKSDAEIAARAADQQRARRLLTLARKPR